MNRLLIPFIAVVMFLLGSCQKECPDVPITEIDGSCELTLSIESDKEGTKAISNDTGLRAFESTVYRITYLVFASNGALEASNNVIGNTSSGIITVSAGAKTVYAFVNVDPSKLRFVTHESDLNYITVDLKDNVLAANKGLTMYGNSMVTILPGAKNVLKSITVSRHVARMVLGRITNALSGPLEGKDIDVDCVFLTNLAGCWPITGRVNYTPSKWYAKCGRAQGYADNRVYIWADTDTEAGALTCQELWEYLDWDDYIEPGAALYFFPHYTSTDHCGWAVPYTARYTRIVVVAEIDGEVYYYPVSITGAQPNKAYTLDLTITRLGSKDPDTFEFCEIQNVVVDISGFDEFDEEFEIIY